MLKLVQGDAKIAPEPHHFSNLKVQSQFIENHLDEPSAVRPIISQRTPIELGAIATCHLRDGVPAQKVLEVLTC